MAINTEALARAVVSGILTGGVYALMAAGLTLVFGVMDIINIAQGAFVVLGAYLSFWLWTHFGLDPFFGLVITIPIMFVLGLVLEILFIRPLKRERTQISILVSYGIAILIEGFLTLFFTTSPRSINTWYTIASVHIGFFYLPVIYLLAMAMSIVLLAALYFLLYRTKFGRGLRATMQNRNAAQLIGIDVEWVSTLTFAIGISLAAAGGMAYGATHPGFIPNDSYDLISRLLVIIILGGMGSVNGALIASISMLGIEAVADIVVGPVWASTVFYILLVILMLFRPQGLFGKLGARRQ
jgi:branched-chain amino acid transport system permease protein